MEPIQMPYHRGLSIQIPSPKRFSTTQINQFSFNHPILNEGAYDKFFLKGKKAIQESIDSIDKLIKANGKI